VVFLAFAPGPTETGGGSPPAILIALIAVIFVVCLIGSIANIWRRR